jgi:4a-hydroxytetrahydrobiopterin dehydratase
MDMLKGDQIAQANLTDWRKLAQGLHARYVVGDFGTGARFVAAVGEAGDALGHHPSVSMGNGYVDFKLVSDDAIYRDGEGTEHVVEWVTQQDVDLARRITEIAADHKVDADPASVSQIELGLDTARSGTIAPVWAALLTGSADAQGRGTPGDEIRDATDGCRTCGSGTPTDTRPRVSGSTSRSMWRPRWPGNGSQLPSPRVGPSSMTATRHRTP